MHCPVSVSREGGVSNWQSLLVFILILNRPLALLTSPSSCLIIRLMMIGPIVYFFIHSLAGARSSHFQFYSESDVMMSVIESLNCGMLCFCRLIDLTKELDSLICLNVVVSS